MAYATVSTNFAKEPVAYVEMDVRACSLVYGVGACTASGSGDGKCQNSFATCQDKANFAATTKTIRFSTVRIDDLQADGDAPTFPTLEGISLSPSTLSPGQGLGIRATCNITLEDHPATMVGIDPYLTDRTFTSQDRGSFWSRLITMFPFYHGTAIRVFTGFLAEDGSYDATNFRQRTYFIDTISGPTENGKIQIRCKDALRFTDAEKAQVPTQSSAILVNDITNVATSFDITDTGDDVKDAYDAGQTYIRIDDETMLITNVTGSNPTYTLTVTRAAMPSTYTGTMTAEAHEANSTVQHCHFFNAAQVDDIIYYLLNTGAGINASYLPTADWQTVIDFGLQSYLFTALITEPTGVKELLEELSEHTIFMWWDEREAEVKIDSIIRRFTSFGPYDDNEHIIADSVSVTRDDKARVSQAWMVFGHRTPVLELDELKNFVSVFVSVDLDAEGVNQYNQKKVKKVFSRWLPLDKRSVATEITNRYLNYYKDTKNIVSLELSAKDYTAWTGDILYMATRLVQDQNGTTPTRGYRILEANELAGKGETKYKYTLQSTSSIYGADSVRYGLITPNTMGNYDVESEANKNRYAFIAYDDRGDGKAGFPVSDEPYAII